MAALHVIDHHGQALESVDREVASPPAVRPCVYVIDDDEGVRASLCVPLSVECFDARAFATARRFLDEVETLPPGSILMDYHLDHEDGIDAAAELRRRGITWRTILITSWLEPDQQERARLAGICTVLEKPFSLDALLNALRL